MSCTIPSVYVDIPRSACHTRGSCQNSALPPIHFPTWFWKESQARVLEVTHHCVVYNLTRLQVRLWQLSIQKIKKSCWHVLTISQVSCSTQTRHGLLSCFFGIANTLPLVHHDSEKIPCCFLLECLPSTRDQETGFQKKWLEQNSMRTLSITWGHSLSLILPAWNESQHFRAFYPTI